MRSFAIISNTAALVAIMSVASAQAHAQHLEGDVRSPAARWDRMLAEPGTFWLDDNDDREIIRYTTPRDVRLCLPRAEGLEAEGNIPIAVTWDQTHRLTLYPGNCAYFDARQVTLKPASPLPSGVTLQGQVDTASALQK